MNGTSSDFFSIPLKDLKLIEFVNEICSDISVKEDEVADVFVKRLIELLFRISESVEILKIKLHKIIGGLVEVGVACRSKLKADRSIQIIEKSLSNRIAKKRKLDTPLNFVKDMEYSDPRFEKVVLLYHIDQKINFLIQDKKKIYGDIFNPSQIDVQLVHDFDPEHSLEKVPKKKKVFKSKTVNKLLEQETRFLTIKPELFPDSNYARSELVEDQNVTNVSCIEVDNETQNEEYKETECWKGSTSSLGSSSKHNSWIVKNLKSPITCLKCYKKLCIVGCLNGELAFISFTNAHVQKVQQMHQERVTSLRIWNKRIITSSLDKRLNCFDMNLCKMKSVDLENPIECMTDDGRGVVYVGTSTGHVHRFNILPLTEIGSSVQISSDKIVCLKTLQVNLQLVLIVSAKSRPLTIRDAETGVLIRTVDLYEMTTCHLLSETLIGTSKNRIYSIQLDNKTVMKTRSLNKECVTFYSYINEIYILHSDGTVSVYNKDLKSINVINISSEIGDDEVSIFSIHENNFIIFLKNQLHLKRFKIDQTSVK